MPYGDYTILSAQCIESMKDISFSNEDVNKILIVDDEPFIRKFLSKYLSGKNFIIETADNGEAAIEKLNEEPFDLVLTDLRMPKMGGRELLQIMSENFPNIPKIVLTGYGTSEDIILALQTGAYDFLSKPITDYKILDHSIKRAIERKKLDDERIRYLEQVNQINEIISMLNRGMSIEDIFHALNTTLKRIIPFNMLALLIINRTNGEVSTKLFESNIKTAFNTGAKFNINDSLLKDVSTTKALLSVDDISDFPQAYPDSEFIKHITQLRFKSLLLLPLIMKDVTSGFLLFAAETVGGFIKSHVSFLETIGGQISISVERGELIDEIEQHNKNLEHTINIRTKEILQTQKTTIFALSKIAETRDQTTGDHLERIRSYCVLLAQILKYTSSVS